jgi:hypothetical protein
MMRRGQLETELAELPVSPMPVRRSVTGLVLRFNATKTE